MAKKVEGVVRVALIGSGNISKNHVSGFLKHPGKIQCVALCDTLDANLKARSDQLGASPRQFKDWKVLLKEMANEIDAVDICLPHHLHAQAIQDAATAGKHILCEKPMCMTLEEADQIEKAVKKAGVTYMSAHNQLFLPVVQEAKRIIDSGELGRIYWLRSQDCFAANRADWGWRGDLKTQGGGELIDTGYHPSYRLLHLAGSPVVEIRSTMGRFTQRIEGEDTASVQVRFANGAIGEVLTSWAMPLPFGTHQIHVVGEKGQIFGSGDTIYLLPKGYTEPAKRNLEKIVMPNTFEAQIEHFADCLREGKRPIHGVEEGRAVLELILKASANADGWQQNAALKV